MKTIKLSVLFILVLSGLTDAQDTGLFEFREFQKAVINKTRSGTGEPGTRYWQNYSDYKLEASVDASKNTLSGKGLLVYHNNSPEVLREIHLRLYEDLYKRGTARIIPIPVEDLTDGTYIGNLKINGIRYIVDNKPVEKSRVNLFYTDLCVHLADSIPSGGSGLIELEWSFPIPSASSELRRMGRYNDNFFLGLWYPQVAVYDDIRGWDVTPHLGLKEFYNDFNNYDVTVNVPEGYMVWGTGECDNLNIVLDEKIIDKIERIGNKESRYF